ncbi:MAG: DUF262 domain-containing protein [Verrucomicrobia bacterium]|nr:DUF262 domain-containing protein [Verrucomicrobiota bacterium]
MSATNFNTKNDTYRKLMGNGLTYRIPRYQRDYSWTEEEWEDLWMDVLGTIRTGGEPAHYMGYLVLQSENDKVFDVIDGQQRLTTLTLIVLAVLKNIRRLIEDGKDADRNRQRLDQIRQTYVGYLDPVTLVSRSKLSLNRNNDTYFQTYIVPLGHLPMRGFRASEHSLRKAFEWFEKRIAAYAAKAGGESGVVLAQFVESLSDRLFFTVITVTDELNAYKVFETLNARGVRLSATDLLKNYLFSVLHKDGQHEHEMKSLENRWEAMVGRLGSESFPDFLRVHWNSRFSFVRQTELFKTIRGRIATRDAVFELVRQMEEDVDAYMALTHPESSQWSPALKHHAADLRMFGVRQPYPLLLAARRSFPDSGFESVLRASVIISFRYNVIGSQPTNEQERVYNAVAEKLALRQITDTGAVLAAVSSVYPGDEVFRAAFAEKTLRTTQSRNRRVVRYILCALEKRLEGSDLDVDGDGFNLEHILPENPETGWNAFTDDEVEALVYRLGNLTLLAKGANSDLGNTAFAAKRGVYAASPFGITRKVAEDNSDWSPERLAARQDWMANQATAIWRVDQLS